MTDQEKIKILSDELMRLFDAGHIIFVEVGKIAKEVTGR